MSAPLTTPQGPSGGRGTVHGDLSQLATPQSRMNGLLYYAVLTVAAGIDIATFYQVLALVMRNVPDAVVWLGVVGFTVTALALAHTMGIRARDAIDEHRRVLGSASFWVLFLVWAFVGVTAFVVRLTATPAQTGGGTTILQDGVPVTFGLGASDDPKLAALLFLALYCATGAVAALAGYLRHNPLAKRYAAALKNRGEVAKVAAASSADLALARQTLYALQEERRRREEGWVKAQEEWQAIARRLKQEARLRLAAAAQNTSTTDHLLGAPPQLRRQANGTGQGTDGPPAVPAQTPPPGYPTPAYVPPGYVPPPGYAPPQPGYVPPGYAPPPTGGRAYASPNSYQAPTAYPAPTQAPVPVVSEQQPWPGTQRSDNREGRR